MKGYLSNDGTYYETCSGPLREGDRLVPLRPSPEYVWEERIKCWVLSTHGHALHHYPRAMDSLAPRAVAASGGESRVFVYGKFFMEVLVMVIGGISAFYSLRQDLSESRLAIELISKQVQELKVDVGRRLDRLENWTMKKDY